MHYIALVGFICVFLLLIYQSSSEYTKQEPEYAVPEKIKIDEELYNKMLDIVLYYSKKSPKQNMKLTLIYLSTFHLFDMNYSLNMLKQLDASLNKYPFVAGTISYPSGNMHHNLQKAIVTNITKHLDHSERMLTDTYNDRVMLDIYLRQLFNDIGVM